MQRVTLANLFMLLCGLLGGYGSILALQRGEWLLTSATGLFSMSLLILPTLEMMTGLPLIDSLSDPRPHVRRLVVVGFGVAVLGMCSISLAAAIEATGVVRVTGVAGLLFFGIGGAWACFAYWHVPAQQFVDQAVERAKQKGNFDEDKHV